FCKRLAKRIMLRPIIQQLNYILPANTAGVDYWRYYGCPQAKLKVCTYYCDVPAATVPSAAERERLLAACGIRPEIAAGKNLIFTVARLAPEKGLHLMIEAFGKLGLAEKNWLWVVAGTGPLKEQLPRQAGELNGRAIFFVGVQPHDVVKSLAGEADLFVLPSTYEPHGIVVPEAMGAGTPVIASDACGAALDYVAPAKTGWLFKNASNQSLCDALVQATASTEALVRMRPACREKYERQYGVTSPVAVVPTLVGRVFGAGMAVEVGVDNLAKPVIKQSAGPVGTGRRDVVAVLGPPRSGSSAIMRGLTCLGVNLGDDINLRAAGPGNPEGFWEDRRVMRLCEETMYGFGLEWDSLRVLDAADLASPLGVGYVRDVAAIIGEGVAGSPRGVWGCKNPRMARLSRLWMAAVQQAGCRDCYVVSLRNPLSVVNSVIFGSPYRGAGHNPTHMYLMWLVHMVGALRPAMAGKPTVVVDFDNFLAGPQNELMRVARALDFAMVGDMPAAMAAYDSEFLKQRLRHSEFSPDDLSANPLVPRIVAKAYEILREAAGDGVAVGSPEFIGQWGAIESQTQELNAVFRYIDSLDHRLMKRQALSRRIYRQMPIKVKRLLARLA
ncbi:MAG: glycosyltransferase, partial [Phycisphaerae bacterium]